MLCITRVLLEMCDVHKQATTIDVSSLVLLITWALGRGGRPRAPSTVPDAGRHADSRRARGPQRRGERPSCVHPYSILYRVAAMVSQSLLGRTDDCVSGFRLRSRIRQARSADRGSGG